MSGRIFEADDVALLESILKNRRDVRGNRFLPDSISDEDIDKLIDAALYSPSVGFSQPWEFVVVREPAVKSQVQDIFAEENAKATDEFIDEKQQQYIQLKLEGITESAVNLAVYYNPAQGPVLGQTSMKEMGLYSVVCAVQNIWLMARAMNIGVGWVSILDPGKVNQVLGMPDDRRLVAYLCIGRVTEFAEKPELESLKWEKRKQKQRLVFSDAFQNPFYSQD